MSLYAHELIYETGKEATFQDQSSQTATTTVESSSSNFFLTPLNTSNSNTKMSISISNPSSNSTSPRNYLYKNSSKSNNIWGTAPLPFRQIPATSGSSITKNHALHPSLFALPSMNSEDISPSYDSIASTVSHSPTYSPFSSFSSTSSPALSPSNDTAEEFSFSCASLSVKLPSNTNRRRHSDGLPTAAKLGPISSNSANLLNSGNVIIYDSNIPHLHTNNSYNSNSNNNTTSGRPELLVPDVALVDPRTRDPERLAALLAIVLHMELSGMQPKLLSQLGIMYKQMYPHLFVKGLLKDMIEHAVHAQLLKLTGPAGQQQVHLSSKARQLSRLNQLTHVGQIASVIPALIGALSSNSAPAHSSFIGSSSPQPSPVKSNTKFVYGFEDSDDQIIMSGSRRQSLGSPFLIENSNSSLLNTSDTNSVSDRDRSNAYDPFSPTHIMDNSSGMIPEEKIFQHEKIYHLKYIYHFRVHSCRAYANKQCPAENKKNSSECFEFHSLKMRRRVLRVVQYSNGWFWSYNACRCTAMEKDQKCDKGDSCRYAHNKEEIAYHPSRYKTQMCAYPTDTNGVCIRFGIHCAFAHSEDDLRKPVVLQQGLPHMLIDDGFSGSALFSKLSQPNNVNIALSPDDYASFRDTNWSELKPAVSSKSKVVGENFNLHSTSVTPTRISPIQPPRNPNSNALAFSQNGVNLSSMSTNSSLFKDKSAVNPPLLKCVFPYSFDSDYDKWSF